MGRPTSYTPEVAAQICERLVAGQSLRTICSADDMPNRGTVAGWVVADVQGFASQYARAKALGIDELVDEAIEIADSPEVGVVETDKVDKDGSPYTEARRGDMIEHRRLRVDTRKWYASKLAPKLYGDRVAHEHSGPDGGPIEFSDDTERAARLTAILTAAAHRRAADENSDLA